MKTVKILFLMLLFLSAFSFSGEIYGTIKAADGKPLVNHLVQIKQNDTVLSSDTTDVNGYFIVNVKEVGKFKLKVVCHSGTSFEVISTNKSILYNLSMLKSDDKWILKSL